MKICIQVYSQNYNREIQYLCKVFGSTLDADIELKNSGEIQQSDQLCIAYCDKSHLSSVPESCKIRILQDKVFWSAYFSKSSPKLKILLNDEVPVIGTPNIDPFIKYDLNSITMNLDIFSSAFLMISRIEEVYTKDEFDAHGRFNFSNTIIGEDLIGVPLVNIYAKKLAEWINIAYGVSIKFREKYMGAVITHDIDRPYLYGTARSEISKIIDRIRRGKNSKIRNELQSYLSFILGITPDQYDVFDYICKTQQRFGIKSTWFILMESEWGLKKHKYRRQLKKLSSSGHEISLHPGYKSFSDARKIAVEKKRVKYLSDIEPAGVRNHFLRFDILTTYKIYETMKFLYDSTMGYADHVGFRAGICTPYKPFDIISRREIDIIELPLVVMDTSLINYQKTNTDDALETIKEIIDEIDRVKGMIVLLWHNHLLLESMPNWRFVYENTLKYLVEKKTKFHTCSEAAKNVIAHWK